MFVRIFTQILISLNTFLRQWEGRYAFHAGHQLSVDKLKNRRLGLLLCRPSSEPYLNLSAHTATLNFILTGYFCGNYYC